MKSVVSLGSTGLEVYIGAVVCPESRTHVCVEIAGPIGITPVFSSDDRSWNFSVESALLDLFFHEEEQHSVHEMTREDLICGRWNTPFNIGPENVPPTSMLRLRWPCGPSP